MYFHALLESTGHARLLNHYDVWILAHRFLNTLGISSLVELIRVLLLLYALIVWYHSALVHVKVGTTYALLLINNRTRADCHYWIIVLLLESNGPARHMLIHFFSRLPCLILVIKWWFKDVIAILTTVTFLFLLRLFRGTRSYWCLPIDGQVRCLILSLYDTDVFNTI